MLLPYYQDELLEAGCDEAGRGCLAGPVVAAAVVLPPDFRHKDLNDSKKMTDKNRYLLRSIIEKEALVYAVAQADSEEIDRINILNASFLAMHRAVDRLTIRPELLLIDGNRFKTYNSTPHVCIVKGDQKYMSIAAASILAKTYRDDLMLRLHSEHPQYGWDRNKAYPTKEHRRSIAMYGVTPYHRRSFSMLPTQS